MLLSMEQITTVQRDLLLTIRELDYGELYSVEHVPDPVLVDEEISPAEKKLLDVLEEENQIDIITVHQGGPVYLEIDKKIEGFRCRKKIKC